MLSALAVPYLPQTQAGEFVFGGKRPLSYTQVRKMCNRIKRDTGFSENITPIRFRMQISCNCRGLCGIGPVNNCNGFADGFPALDVIA